MKTQPSSTATAGAPFGVQPQINICDNFGNVLTADNSTQITAARGSIGTSTLQGTLTKTAVNGVVTFTDLLYNKSENLKINFTSGGLTNVESNSINVATGTPSKIIVVTQPADMATANAIFTQQPSVKLQDANNNDIKTAGISVTASLKTGSGAVQGTQTIVTDANGIAAFVDLSYNKAEDIILQFTSSSLTSAESTQISVASSIADFNYSDNGASIAITGYVGAGGRVVIPKFIIGKPVTSVEYMAFAVKTAITGIVFPNSLTKIGEGAFYNCLNLDGVAIPNSVTLIGQYAFSESGITSITIPGTVSIIGDYAFSHCYKLSNVTIQNGVTSINSGAFFACPINEINIPASVNSIGGRVFAGGSLLQNINVDTNNTTYSSINGVLFNKNQTKIINYPVDKSGSYVIPSSVTNIEAYAFSINQIKY
ncbi:MAG TPA: leucine-rich repeat domain-containing protein, partial [Candidatus Wallbacteria bacterium]|nr:leucine-rich repeat domain-containing protein [Candidatus Wallbacteria bacterium]